MPISIEILLLCAVLFRAMVLARRFGQRASSAKVAIADVPRERQERRAA